MTSLNRYSLLLLLLGTYAPMFAQQNLFNIPSADITPKGKVFYQHQINLYSDRFESKGHFVLAKAGMLA
jgi:hypothetical protein